jgi:preprotein translocase subunit SecB
MIDHSTELNPDQTNATPELGKLMIEGIYIKEQSCKVPYAPAIYQQKDAKPDTNLELNVKNSPQQENKFEVVVTLNLTMKVNQQTAVTIEVQQAGLFHIEDFNKEQQAYLLGAYCPNVLFPYARKAISDLCLGAGFAAVPLPPINFESLYQQRLQNAQSEAGAKMADTLANEKITLN